MLGLALVLGPDPLRARAEGLEDGDAAGLIAAIVEAAKFSQKERARVEAGEVVSKASEHEERRELGLTVVGMIDAPVSRVFEAARDEVLDIDASILAHGPLPDGEIDASSFEGLVLPESELEALLDEDRADDFNLSKAEGEALAAVALRTKGAGRAERHAAIDAAFRSLMADRVNAYRERGVDGIVSYTRSDGREIAPRDDLHHAIASFQVLRDHAGAFFEVLAGKPGDDSGLVEHRLEWRLQTIQDRPTFVLSHRGLATADSYGLGFARNYYVAHSFDDLQIVTAVFTHEGGSLLFYGNRTYTEQVAGFGSAAAHRIGRGFLTKEVETLFEAIRKELEGS